MPGRLFIIYDERAMTMNTDEAQVLCTEMFPCGVIFSYDTTDDDMLINEAYEPHSKRGW